MLGIFTKPFTSFVINAGILCLRIFIHCALLVSWFLCRSGPAICLFDARVIFGVGIGVGGVINFLCDSPEVALIENLRSKFVILVGLYLEPLELLLPGLC